MSRLRSPPARGARGLAGASLLAGGLWDTDGPWLGCVPGSADPTVAALLSIAWRYVSKGSLSREVYRKESVK